MYIQIIVIVTSYLVINRGLQFLLFKGLEAENLGVYFCCTPLS